MLHFIRQIRQRWDDWCGDREMELSIRRHLTEHGYFGTTAKLRSVRLIAVQRPGWQQVFRFEATARVNPESAQFSEAFSDDPTDTAAIYHELFGLVREDLRAKISDTRVFDDSGERAELFRRWSDGMIRLRGAHGLADS
ncbi:hypothetical protein [Crateriforma conspicua]|uniref:Uncharacterized protein n=1 Tax=Crateriforma conspicua TaxID=2527996 RepID=A0A5C5Y3H5_9PLAN|nr:hypothetical protein [Crateriforma conspicua]QDV64918.1 hypothetical protein Mal65_40860 [Crateriforma conspicua]TWT70316.1 hypothetical protein Pan14r_26210 [Crateriforma conspicua]